MPLGCYKRMSFIKEGVIMRLQCSYKIKIFFVSKRKVKIRSVMYKIRQLMDDGKSIEMNQEKNQFI